MALLSGRVSTSWSSLVVLGFLHHQHLLSLATYRYLVFCAPHSFYSRAFGRLESSSLCLCLAHVPCRCFTPGSHDCWTGYPTLENPPPGLTTLMTPTRRWLSTLVSLAQNWLSLVIGTAHRSPLRPFQLVVFRTNLHQVLHWDLDYTLLPLLRPTFAIYSTRARSRSRQDF